MLKIKLFQKGKKHQRTFRVVVSEARSKANGNFVDDLGFYTPQTKTFQIDQEKLEKWIKNGAQVTLGVDKLLNPDKHPRKKKNLPTAAAEPSTVKPSEPAAAQNTAPEPEIAAETPETPVPETPATE